MTGMDIVRAALIALARAGIATVGRVPSHIDRLSQREEEKEGGRERERETERKRESDTRWVGVGVCGFIRARIRGSTLQYITWH